MYDQINKNIVIFYSNYKYFHIGYDWVKVLHTDVEGEEIFGTKAALRRDVLNGAELRVIINGWYGKCYIPNVHNVQVSYYFSFIRYGKCYIPNIHSVQVSYYFSFLHPQRTCLLSV